MSYNMQFQFQRLLQNLTRLAGSSPLDHQTYLRTSNQTSEFIHLLLALLEHVDE